MRGGGDQKIESCLPHKLRNVRVEREVVLEVVGVLAVDVEGRCRFLAEAAKAERPARRPLGNFLQRQDNCI
jgi:hypothetical protein